MAYWFSHSGLALVFWGGVVTPGYASCCGLPAASLALARPGATDCRPPPVGFPDVVGDWIDGARVSRFPNAPARDIRWAFPRDRWLDSRGAGLSVSERAGARHPAGFPP